MKLCIIRHGETDWNVEDRMQGREDIPLNENGIQQAKACSMALQGETNWKRIVASTLSRAERTAQEIAKVLGLTVELDADLVEIDMGACSGMNHEERWTAFPDGVYPGMETMDAVLERACRAMDKCIAAGQDTIVVSHGGTIRAYIEWVLQKSLKGTRMKNCSISILEDAQVLLFNLAPEEYKEYKDAAKD